MNLFNNLLVIYVSKYTTNMEKVADKLFALKSVIELYKTCFYFRLFIPFYTIIIPISIYIMYIVASILMKAYIETHTVHAMEVPASFFINLLKFTMGKHLHLFPVQLQQHILKIVQAPSLNWHDIQLFHDAIEYCKRTGEHANVYMLNSNFASKRDVNRVIEICKQVEQLLDERNHFISNEDIEKLRGIPIELQKENIFGEKKMKLVNQGIFDCKKLNDFTHVKTCLPRVMYRGINAGEGHPMLVVDNLDDTYSICPITHGLAVGLPIEQLTEKHNVLSFWYRIPKIFFKVLMFIEERELEVGIFVKEEIKNINDLQTNKMDIAKIEYFRNMYQHMEKTKINELTLNKIYVCDNHSIFPVKYNHLIMHDDSQIKEYIEDLVLTNNGKEYVEECYLKEAKKLGTEKELIFKMKKAWNK